ncbi:MAG: PQQ-binding-like beta-propeller repeat protein, partial [Thermoplasmata archaeon]|nr:PQQ-binding-like beta-propeller repeat protein [Thermoplasmata archaeon]
DFIDNDLDGIIDNEGELRWRFGVDNEIFSSPSIHNGNAYFGSGEYSTSASPGSVYALNETNGGLVWRYQGADGFLSSALIADNKVFIGSNDDYLTALCEGNGTILWQYKAEGGGSQRAFGSSPSLYDEKIVVGCCNGRVYCFEMPNYPPEVELLLPEDNSCVNASIVLKWKGTDPNRGDIEKLRYDVYLATDYDLVNGSDGAALISLSRENESFAPPALLEGEEYYWKVVVNDTEFENVSEVWSLTVNRRPELHLTSPEEGGRITSTSITLVWEGSDGDGDNLTYDVYFDTDPIPVTIVSDNLIEESFEASDLVEGVRYYWKVVASDGIDENVSEVWNFSVNKKPEVHLISPEDCKTVTLIPVVLIWEGSDENGDELSYDVYLDDHSSPTTVAAEDLAEESFETSGLERGKTYYWKIAASDGYGESEAGIWSFTVDIAAASNNAPIIELISPEDGAVIDSTSVTLNWEGNDQDGDTLFYDVYVDTESDPETLAAEDLTEGSYDLTGLEEWEVYYWKVVVSDGLDEAESDIWDFSIDTGLVTNHAPEVRLTFPQNGSIIPSDSINLIWVGSDEDNDRLTYDVYLSMDPNASTLVSEDQVGKAYFASGLESGRTYYWRVAASDGEDETTSPIWNFTVREEGNDDDEEWYEDIMDEPLYLGGIIAAVVAVVAGVVMVLRRRRGGWENWDQ